MMRMIRFVTYGSIIGYNFLVALNLAQLGRVIYPNVRCPTWQWRNLAPSHVHLLGVRAGSGAEMM
jgi:hypothetical protein